MAVHKTSWLECPECNTEFEVPGAISDGDNNKCQNPDCGGEVSVTLAYEEPEPEEEEEEKEEEEAE